MCKKPCKECPWTVDSHHNKNMIAALKKWKKNGSRKSILHRCHMVSHDLFGQINHKNICAGSKLHNMDDKKVISGDEARMPMTFDRFSAYHVTVGEDFCDQEGELIDTKLLANFIKTKTPQFSDEIDKILSTLPEKYLEPLILSELYNRNEVVEDGQIQDGNTLFYTYLAEFLNLPGNERMLSDVNQALITAQEQYGE